MTKKKIFNEWLPANELGIAEGYIEGYGRIAIETLNFMIYLENKLDI